MSKVTWSQLKQFITNNSLAYSWRQDDNSYTITAANWQTIIPFSNPLSSEQYDFETNYKSVNSISPLGVVNVQSAPAFGAKTIIVAGQLKRLFARFTGFQSSVSLGANTITYTATYPWAKMIGIEVVNCDQLDTADLKIYDTAGGTYSGVPNALLNQFSYSLNLPADYYLKMAQFDADLYAGMVIKITYNSVAVLPKTVGINLLLNEVMT